MITIHSIMVEYCTIQERKYNTVVIYFHFTTLKRTESEKIDSYSFKWSDSNEPCTNLR